MSNESDHRTDRRATHEKNRQAPPTNPLDTDNVEASVIQGSRVNPATELDTDVPGLSPPGAQSAPAIEPDEPA